MSSQDIETYADLSAFVSSAREVLDYFCHRHVTVVHLEEELHGGLYPCVTAPQARCFDEASIVQVAKFCVV